MLNSIGQFTRAFVMLVCLLLSLFSLTADLQAQDNQDQAQDKQEQAQNKPAQHTETLTPLQVLDVNEMAALRARMGGGVTERLEGVVEGANPEQQFLDSLKTLVRSQKQPELSSLQPKNSPAPVDGALVATIVGPNAIYDSETSEATKIQYAQRTLRSSAKKLEELAAELEQARFYEKADELRQTAAKYWVQARTMD